MIALILTFAMANCPETKIVNHTKTWNEQDQKTLDRAKKRCGQLYPEAPCVKVFTKKDDSTYTVACGV